MVVIFIVWFSLYIFFICCLLILIFNFELFNFINKIVVVFWGYKLVLIIFFAVLILKLFIIFIFLGIMLVLIIFDIVCLVFLIVGNFVKSIYIDLGDLRIFRVIFVVIFKVFLEFINKFVKL